MDRAARRCDVFLYGAIRTILAESKQMTTWRPQPFRTAAQTAGRDTHVIKHALETAMNIVGVTPGAEPILSLKHLSHLSGSSYSKIREVVRRSEPEPYRVFKIHKRPLPGESKRFRTIVVPAPWLMALHRWLNTNVLDHVAPHEASVAFSRGNSIRKAASLHCSSSWLIKMDIQNFFESITERQVQRVFLSMGYQPLVSFELARLCTRIGQRHSHAYLPRYQSRRDWSVIGDYSEPLMGQLPQGAPSSPKIANLAARELDESLSKLAKEQGFTYSRYADDLTFSTFEACSRNIVRPLIGDISAIIGATGFSPNTAKTTVSPPGTRKVVLGLLVDRDEPRLTREFKMQLRQHLYYLGKFGGVSHAMRKGNATVFGLRRHVLGLIQHARQIEREYGDAQLEAFNTVHW